MNNEMEAVIVHLRRVNRALTEKDARIAELSHHLDRINASGWWRLGMFIDRSARSLLSRWTRDPAATTSNATAELSSPTPVPEPASIVLPPPAAEPEVSLVVLSYGKVDYTLRCLTSIATHLPACPIEIVVSDDCSNAPDLDRLQSVANIRFLSPPGNVGFLRHANWAVSQSRGAYVHLLNNDTEFCSDATGALLATLRAFPDAGLAGSKLLWPDGLLQEAGGIVWQDGSASNYGRRDFADKPEYNYLRETDYVSGASLLTPRTLWDRLGGFDEHFAPAYYEDTDYAFRVRREGFKVLYQPASVVVHHEGVSHGVDMSAGVKAYMGVNQIRMHEKWAATLKAEHFPPHVSLPLARSRSKGRVALVIDDEVPSSEDPHGALKLIKTLLGTGYDVKFWPENLRYDSQRTPRLQQMGVETFYFPWEIDLDDWLDRRAGHVDLVIFGPGVTEASRQAVAHAVSGVLVQEFGSESRSETYAQ